MINVLFNNSLSSYAVEKTGITIDTVISFKAGYGQNSGQESKHYPNNIFGIPNRFSSDKIAETSPYEILSLGIGGEIIVSFKNYTILNGVGIDFVIFENSFINPVNKKYFAEPAVISVSYDGLEYFDFPYNYETLEGCAGVNPTIGDKNPYDYPSSGGDGFDLNIVGINEIKYIKIKDITESIYQNKNHLYYDAVLSGFDLDAVVGLNYRNILNNDTLMILPISFENNTVRIFNSQNITNNNYKISDINEVKIYSLLGNEVITSKTVNSDFMELNGVFPNLIFINVIFNNGTIITTNCYSTNY